MKVITYPSANTIIEQNCCYPYQSYDERCCNTTEMFYSDSVDITKLRFRGSHGCVLDSADTEQVEKVYKKNGEEYYVETMWGDKEYHHTEYNKAGLPAVKTITNAEPGSKVRKIRYQYFQKKK